MMRSLKKVFTIAVLMSAVLFILGIAQASTLTLPADTKVIEEEAFYGDTSLDEVVLPDQIKRIESKAFSKSSVKTVFLPDSLEFIADDAFDRDADINMTAIPGSNAYIWAVDHGFIKETDIIIPSNAGDFEYSDNDDGTCTVTKYIGTNKENIVIPKWSPKSKLVTVIGCNAFRDRNDLTGSLTIPDSVISIEAYAFCGCRGFTGTLKLPNSLKRIMCDAFNGCSGFTGNLIIPDSVTLIENSAFWGCRGFTGNLTIPEGMISIANYTFSFCSGFTGSLTIPETVTSIGNGAFYGCIGFTGSLKIPESVTLIGNKAFYNCCGFTGSLTIPDSVISIGSEAFYSCRGFSGRLTISDSLTSIEYGVFDNCSGFTGNLIIPETVTAIGNNAFYSCSGFSGDLVIPGNVTTIGINAFYNCSGFIGSLTLSDSVISIGSAAFAYCSGFTGELTLPRGLTLIEPGVFAYCSGFTGSLRIPDSVTTIEFNAFAYCSGFNGDLIVPNNVKSIDKDAFLWCNNLKKIALQITNSDGTTDEVLRTAVYCPVGSHAWSWAESQPSFEPVEWDGNPSTLPEESQLTGAFTDDSITLTIGEPNKIPAGYVKSIGKDIYRVSITVAGYEMDDPVNNRYATDVFVDHHTKEVNLTDWAAFYLDTTRAPFNVPGEYTIKLWANTSDADASSDPLDSMTVIVNDSVIGYIKEISIATYENPTIAYGNGVVNNIDPVWALQTKNNRTQIKMILSAGGTDIRWVDKDMIIYPSTTATPEVEKKLSEEGVEFTIKKIDGYDNVKIERSTLDPELGWTLYKEIYTTQAVSVIDATVERDVQYKYRFWGINGDQYSSPLVVPVNCSEMPKGEALPSPENLRADAYFGYYDGPGSAYVSWSSVRGASFYNVYYSQTLFDTNAMYISTERDGTHITGLQLGMYYIWVKSVNKYGLESEIDPENYVTYTVSDVTMSLYVNGITETSVSIKFIYPATDVGHLKLFKQKEGEDHYREKKLLSGTKPGETFEEIDFEIEPGVVYNYYVASENGSFVSNEASVLAVPMITSFEAYHIIGTKDLVCVNWGKEPEENCYVQVQASFDDENHYHTVSTDNTGPGCLVDRIDEDSIAYFRIRQFRYENNGIYYSLFSDPVAVKMSNDTGTFRYLIICEEDYIEPEEIDNTHTYQKSMPGLLDNTEKTFKSIFNVATPEGLPLNKDQSYAKKNQSRQDIKTLIETMSNNVQDNSDITWVHIFAHGNDYSGGTGELFLSSYNDTGILVEEPLDLQTLAKWLSKIPGRVIVSFASCGSGAAIYNKYTEAIISENTDIDIPWGLYPGFYTNAEYILSINDRETILNQLEFPSDISELGSFRQGKFVVLTGSDIGEKAWNSGSTSSKSYICEYLKEGLTNADKNNDGIITVYEMNLFLERKNLKAFFMSRIYPDHGLFELLKKH